jgi:putative colanic acid biosynthesis acetyltransferase WcaF
MNPPPKVDLSRYSPGDYQPGPLALRVLWYVASIVFIETWIPWPATFKAGVLRFFGAKVGAGVVLKPRLRIKYPWFLTLGDHVWLGEEVWIDNLAPVKIGSHACLSQGACVLTGNHDYQSASFDLRLAPVEIGEGAWIGAKCVVCPGATIGDYAVLHAGSVVKGDCETNGIYAGNPATRIGMREIRA